MDRNNDVIDLKSRLKNEDFKNDDMNLKLHLNESLDIKGISVSEDLINRTLKAIKVSEEGLQETTLQGDKQQERETNHETSSKKIIAWSRPVRKIAGTAAAILVVAVGFRLMTGDNAKFMMMDKADTTTSQDENMYGTVDSSNGTAEKSTDSSTSSVEDSTGTSAPDETFTSAAPKLATQEVPAAEDNSETDLQTTEGTADEAMIGESKLQASDATGNKSSGDDTVPETETAGDGAQRSLAGLTSDIGFSQDTNPEITGIVKEDNQEYMTFQNIFLADSKLAKSIKIIDEINNTEIVLTEQSDIYNFYTLMGQQKYTASQVAPSAQNYKVELVGQQSENVMYSMVIGDLISIDNIEDIVNQSNYNVENIELLIQKIDGFYQSYSQ